MAATKENSVPVKVFRDRYEELLQRGETAHDIAARLGWYDHAGRPDAHRVKRTIGLKGYQLAVARGSRKLVRQRVTFEVAKRLADAMNLDYHEVGL